MLSTCLLQAMVNEQKHAITAYPPVTLAASEVWSGEPRVPKWKGNQEPECPSPSSEPPSTPSTPVGGPLRNTLAAMSTAVLSMIKSMSRRQGLRLETRTVSEGAITGGEDVLSPTAKRGEQLPGGRSPERRTGDVDSSQAIHIHSPTVQAPTPQFKSFVTKFKAAKVTSSSLLHAFSNLNCCFVCYHTTPYLLPQRLLKQRRRLKGRHRNVSSSPCPSWSAPLVMPWPSTVIWRTMSVGRTRGIVKICIMHVTVIPCIPCIPCMQLMFMQHCGKAVF